MNVNISEKQRQTFGNVIKLVKSGLLHDLDEQIYYDERNDAIVYGEDVFTLGDNGEETASEQKLTDKGASWFARIRKIASGTKKKGEVIEDVDVAGNKWIKLIERITELFHKKYSFLEYCQKSGENQRTAEEDKARIKKLFSDYYKELKYVISRPANVGNSSLDLYGATVKTAVTDGTKDESTVICKLVFEKTEDDTFIPLPSDEVESINKLLTTFDEEGDDTLADAEGQIRIRESLLSVLENFFGGMDKEGINDISDYVSYAAEEDRRNIEVLVEHGPSNEVSLRCTGVKLLSIFHCKWNVRKYVICNAVTGKPLFECSFGIGNGISVKCVCCGEDIIKNEKFVVDGIIYDIRDNDKEILNNGKNGLKSLFRRHGFTVSCGELNIKNPSCSKTVCEAGCITLKDKSGKIRKVCKNCEYPEVLSYVNIDGIVTPVLTETLEFDRWRLCLTPKTKSNLCACCGREIPETENFRYCSLCREIIDDEIKENKKARTLYKKYSYMFSFVKRAVGGRPRVCVEDEETILFRLGNNIYKFDKSEYCDGGRTYLPAPKKCHTANDNK